MIRDGYSSCRSSEEKYLDGQLLAGLIKKTITVRNILWSAEKCKNNPDYLAKMKLTGAYHDMFSLSPSCIFFCVFFSKHKTCPYNLFRLPL